MCANGFVKLNRCKETEELLAKEYDCFALLTLIAYRAKRTSEFSALGLKIGEALIGDYKACGLTERRYRTSKDKLEKWGFATFKATNKGTIATLCNSLIYDINVETIDEPNANKRRASDEQATTNKNDKKERNKEVASRATFLEVKNYFIEKTKCNGTLSEEFTNTFIEHYNNKGWPTKISWQQALEKNWINSDWWKKKIDECKPKPRTFVSGF